MPYRTVTYTVSAMLLPTEIAALQAYAKEGYCLAVGWYILNAAGRNRQT